MELAWVIAVGALATVSDAWTRRIPNWLTLSAALSGLALASGLPWEVRPRALLVGLGLTAASLLVYGVFSAMDWLGWGDTKLLAAFAALGDPVFVLNLAVWTGLSGAVLGLLQALPRIVWPLVLTDPVGHVLRTLRGEPLRFPYGLAISTGALLALLVPIVGRGIG